MINLQCSFCNLQWSSGSTNEERWSPPLGDALLGVSRSVNTTSTLKLLVELESAFIRLLQEQEMSSDGNYVLNLRRANEALCREGLGSHIDTLGRTIKYLRDDWTKLERGVPGVEVSQYSTDSIRLQLRTHWDDVMRLSSIRRELSDLILRLLTSKPNASGGGVVSF